MALRGDQPGLLGVAAILLLDGDREPQPAAAGGVRPNALDLGYAGGFYSPKRDIVFIRAGNSPEELAGVLIHEATHRVGKANPLRGNDFLSEAIAERDELRRILDG